MNTETKTTAEMLTEAGFSLECGPTQIIKKEDWGDQVVGQTTVILRYKGEVITNTEYNRGLGHFGNLPPMPQKDVSLFSREQRESYITEYENNIKRLKELRPLVESFDRNRNSGSAFERFKEDLKYKRENGKEILIHDEKRLANGNEYVDLIGYISRDKSIKKKSCIFYPGSYDQAIDWYRAAIERHQKNIDNVCKHEKELSQWEKEVLGTYLESDDHDPTLEEVTHSIVCCDATEEDFEDWCITFGYDNDSMKAHKMWRQCHQLGLTLSTLNVDTEKVNEILEDY